MKQEKLLLLVNFGGPRSLEEISPFLRELLCDQEVIRTKWPAFLHRFLFTQVANKRAKNITCDYAKIGGKSPIYEDTEAIAELLRKKVEMPVLTFHRYLTATHQEFIQRLTDLDPQEIEVFPLFPQFSHATTGSCALWFTNHLSPSLLDRLCWIQSYATHPAYVQAKQALIRDFLQEKGIEESEVLLLFSAHGLPQHFICTGDIYQNECIGSYEAIRAGFPRANHLLSYQSKFGKGEWLRPYTNEVCEKIEQYGKKKILFVPLSFSSDHIETLFEIEELYLPIVKEKGLNTWRIPALNRRSDWIQAITTILKEDGRRVDTAALLRDCTRKRCPNCWCKKDL